MVFLCTSCVQVFFLVLNGKCCIFKVNTSSCVATKFLEGVKLIIKVFIPVEKSKSIVFVECCKVFVRVPQELVEWCDIARLVHFQLLGQCMLKQHV